MEEQNRGIFSLYELLYSKTFTDNQKENLTWGKLDEVKAFVNSISKELVNLSIILEQTMFDVVNLISNKIKDQTSIVKTHYELMELKTKNSNMELKHLMEQHFLEQDTRSKRMETTVKE
ncbi:hypothetical protein Dimus_024602, partial [Dionaea muscipula]